MPPINPNKINIPNGANNAPAPSVTKTGPVVTETESMAVVVVVVVVVVVPGDIVVVMLMHTLGQHSSSAPSSFAGSGC